MKKFLTTTFTMLIACALFAGSSNYYIDDAAVENKLNSATQVVFDANTMQFNGDHLPFASIEQGDPNPWIAFILAWVVGGLGIHRVYLGGKTSLILIYVVTCFGIFGIVPLVDWIVLLIGAVKNDISAYVNNDSFFMWGG